MRQNRGRWIPHSSGQEDLALRALLMIWPYPKAALAAYDLAVEHAKAGKRMVFDNSVGKTTIDFRDGKVEISFEGYQPDVRDP